MTNHLLALILMAAYGTTGIGITAVGVWVYYLIQERRDRR